MLLDIDTVAYTHALYTLDYENRKTPVRCTNPLTWIEWMQNNPTELTRVVLPTQRELITVFAGYAGERRESRPYTFCTFVKPEPELNDFKIVLAWYATWNEAMEGQNQMAERFRQLRNPTSDANNAFGRVKRDNR